MLLKKFTSLKKIVNIMKTPTANKTKKYPTISYNFSNNLITKALLQQGIK
jgi:hypothetical protein